MNFTDIITSPINNQSLEDQLFNDAPPQPIVQQFQQPSFQNNPQFTQPIQQFVTQPQIGQPITQPQFTQTQVEVVQPQLVQPQLVQQQLVQQQMIQQPQVIQPQVIQPQLVQQPQVIQPQLVQQPQVIQPQLVQQPQVEVIQQQFTQPLVQTGPVIQSAINSQIIQQQAIQVEEEFIPTLQPDQRVVLKLSSGKFDLFVKVLTNLDDKNVITITNSQICQSINNNSTIIFADLKELLGVNIDLHILSPKKYLKHFKNIKGGIVYIIDSINDQRYLVTNGDITIYLPKQLENLSSLNVLPDMTNAIIVSPPMDIDKETRATISNLAGESAIELIIKNTQLKGVYIPQTAMYTFKQFIKENISEASADLKLKCFSFLRISAEKYNVSIYQANGIYWLLTNVDTGIKFYTYENIQPVNDENLLI